MKSAVDQMNPSVNSPSDCVYAAEAQGLSEEAWTSVIEGFDDTLLMQTWPYGARRWGAENLSHLVLRRNGHVAAAAQVVIMKIPLLGPGIAYVKWGPLWRPRAQEKD